MKNFTIGKELKNKHLKITIIDKKVIYIKI